MAKRGATSDINHDNWDEPFQAEEAGSFATAPKEALQKRTIRVAKRRVKPSESDEGKTAFAAFTGFKPAVPTLNTTGCNKSFSFLGGLTSSSSGALKTNGKTSSALVTKPETTPQEKYLSDLQQLNRSVLDWIKTHVESNPVCILTPVFKDYDKHLTQIQDERDAGEKSGSIPIMSAPSSLASFNFVSSSTTENKFQINIPKTESSKKSLNDTTSSLTDNKQSPSLFGLASATGKSPLLQGSDASTTAQPSIFSSFKGEATGSTLLQKPDPASLMVNPFTSVLNKPELKPFSTSNGSTPTSSSVKKEVEDDEETEEPPKEEFTPVQEEGSVFSTRCKVFVKKDNNYKERGVGTLFIKQVGEGKHQLLVRAETVLGNVLVNVLLSSGVPSQRMGSNNVMLVCLPTPQDPPPPTTVLLRVKTAADADQLLATIQKYTN